LNLRKAQPIRTTSPETRLDAVPVKEDDCEQGLIGHWAARVAAQWHWLFVFSAAAVFLWRGPWRALGRSSDLGWNYLSSRAWMAGQNPYDLTLVLLHRPPDFPPGFGLDQIVSPYPPAIFPLIAPFALPSWTIAVTAFALFNTGLWLVALILLSRLFKLSDVGRSLTMGFCLLSYSMQSAISLGQYSATSISLVLIAWCLSRDVWPSDRSAVVAALGAISLAMKPQIGIVIVIVWLLERRWALLWKAGSVYGMLTAVSVVVTLGFSGSLGIEAAYQSVVAVYQQQSNPFCCVNLRALTTPLLAPGVLRGVVEAGALFAVILALVRRLDVKADHGVRLFAGVYVAALLPIYHRPYDLAGLVILVFLLAVTSVRDWKWWALIPLVVLVSQPVPTLAALGTLAIPFPQDGSALAQIFRIFVIPHSTWALLLGLVGLSAMGTGSGKNAASFSALAGTGRGGPLPRSRLWQGRRRIALCSTPDRRWTCRGIVSHAKR